MWRSSRGEADVRRTARARRRRGPRCGEARVLRTLIVALSDAGLAGVVIPSLSYCQLGLLARRKGVSGRGRGVPAFLGGTEFRKGEVEEGGKRKGKGGKRRWIENETGEEKRRERKGEEEGRIDIGKPPSRIASEHPGNEKGKV